MINYIIVLSRGKLGIVFLPLAKLSTAAPGPGQGVDVSVNSSRNPSSVRRRVFKPTREIEKSMRRQRKERGHGCFPLTLGCGWGIYWLNPFFEYERRFSLSS
jgi:hypothetical protein